MCTLFQAIRLQIFCFLKIMELKGYFWYIFVFNKYAHVKKIQRPNKIIFSSALYAVINLKESSQLIFNQKYLTDFLWWEHWLITSWKINTWYTAQPAFTCSGLIIEILEQGVKFYGKKFFNIYFCLNVSQKKLFFQTRRLSSFPYISYNSSLTNSQVPK